MSIQNEPFLLTALETIESEDVIFQQNEQKIILKFVKCPLIKKYKQGCID